MNRAGAPEYCEDDGTAADGAFSYVVPTVPMEMRISARGYRDWSMIGLRDARTVSEIDVRLKRLP